MAPRIVLHARRLAKYRPGATDMSPAAQSESEQAHPDSFQKATRTPPILLLPALFSPEMRGWLRGQPGSYGYRFKQIERGNRTIPPCNSIRSFSSYPRHSVVKQGD